MSESNVSRVPRVSRGLYLHRKGDVYFVEGVGTLHEDGHGTDPGIERTIVTYESTRSVFDGRKRHRWESDFSALIEWPDGIVRPRFVRVGAFLGAEGDREFDTGRNK